MFDCGVRFQLPVQQVPIFKAEGVKVARIIK
jgi:hypothetical protein